MKRIVFHFDPISPFAYLAFERLPQVLAGCSYEVAYRPVLFAGLLQHWGNKGPAEIEPKKAWTFRQAAWLAREQGVQLDVPAQHPFNPLALLRLAIACAPVGSSPSRRVCERLLHHVWHGGGDANDALRLRALRDTLNPMRDPAGDDVKHALKEATAQAASHGIFGVPTIAVDGKLFWGLDSLPVLAAYLRGDAWFDGPAWEAAGHLPQGVQRRA